MSTLTINPADADVLLSESIPNTNLESTELQMGPQPTLRWRSILKFDFSALPVGAVISAATLKLYYYASNPPDPAGRTIDACELTQTGWLEAEATWNSYKTGSAWAVAGGDFTATDKASAVVPASAGAWMSWNVLALAQHFQSTHSEVAHFLLKDSDESGINNYIPVFYSRTNGNANKPYLEITYTIPDTTPPVITLLGNASETIKQYATYADAGATALDETDGDITGDIVTVNPVDTNVPATYTITYNVSDAALNPAVEVTREVIVDALWDFKTKNTAVYTNKSKNTATFTNKTKNNASWVNKSKS